MSPPPAPASVTEILRAAGQGDAHAAERLFDLLYDELRHVARAELGRFPPGQTLQPTALVNEAYLRLVDREVAGLSGRRDFVRVAGRAMHDVLVDEARRKASLKRGGAWSRADWERLQIASEAPDEELLALEEVLGRLAAMDPRKAEIVQLRFFVGLDEEEVADVLGISDRTVRRDWRFARTWLMNELEKHHPGGPQA